MELRLLFSAIRACGEGRAADGHDAHNVATVDLQHPARALLQAIVGDRRAWQTDPRFRDELEALLTEPAKRGRRVAGGS